MGQPVLVNAFIPCQAIQEITELFEQVLGAALSLKCYFSKSPQKLKILMKGIRPLLSYWQPPNGGGAASNPVFPWGGDCDFWICIFCRSPDHCLSKLAIF